MLTVDHFARIRQLRREGWTLRQIARELKHSPKTILKAFANPEPPPMKMTPRSAPVFGPFRAIVDAMMAADAQAPPKQRHTAAQIYRRLVAEHGYRGQYDQIRRYLRDGRLLNRETFSRRRSRSARTAPPSPSTPGGAPPSACATPRGAPFFLSRFQAASDPVELRLQLQTRGLQRRSAIVGQPGLPVRVEHEYERKGALNLFAAFDTRTGKVYAHTAERKRQKEFIEFLDQLDREIPPEIRTVHLVMDNLRMHTGKQVQAWLEKHPRFQFHHPPVHCSWMNQVEQWFSILQRKRLAIADFKDTAHLAERLQAFVKEWNEHAHPFQWTKKSVAKVLAKCEIAKSEPPRGNCRMICSPTCGER